MVLLNKCWTPFMIYSWTTIKIGCYYVAAYISVIHILAITYSLYVISGGSSDEFYSPFFELDKRQTTGVGSFAIVFSFIFILACISLVFGVKKENRLMFFPFIIGMVIEIAFMIGIGIWFLFRYYYNSYSVLATACLWSFDILHSYCLLCVISQIQILKEMQEPRFIILHP